ncbi:unnamed protein product [Brassicogethes aeneus]|uniref:Uncharacterized protein n=1 Tax=Brassicogethes aeneus TaxID=1431903 RepID=A0A9P0B7E4_BRAAE|nr:unnamed protein product [Brassicogethes aeneus]
MDCCNYMPYRHHQNYYGGPYYDPLPQYRDDYYHHGPPLGYSDYYGPSLPYYQQHWQCAPSFQDYVYNPKEARIRKALREATRDRSIGASPMLPRPSARRASHGWMPTHDEPLLMSPLSGMRSALDSPICFPMSGSGSRQFMPPMGAYGKMDAATPQPPPPTANIHNYMHSQPNPLMQQQTEMWHNYQESMRPRSSGISPYMMQDPYSQAQQDCSSLMMEKHQRQTHSVSSTSMSMTPPHSNENVPPDECSREMPMNNGQSNDASSGPIDYNVKSSEAQPLMESNVMQPQNEQFVVGSMGGQYGGNLQNFEKLEEMKLKKTAMRATAPAPIVRKKPLPDFNEAFGSTERGRFQSPPDPRLAPNNVDYFLDSEEIKFEDFQI